jgi:hypothetical protein
MNLLRKLGLTADQVRNANGIERTPVPTPPAFRTHREKADSMKATIIAMYAEGLPSYQIGRQIGIKGHVIGSKLKLWGHSIKRGRRAANKN